jgi:hypothetical protein
MGGGLVTPRRAAGLVALAGALLSLLAAPACGSDCTETLTCADQPGDDGSPAGDRSISDQNAGGDTHTGDVTMPLDAACDKAAVENCTNNFDDNCDGKIDCADPMCNAQGFACVPAAPNGWTGPVAYYSGASESPACPAAYPTDSLNGHSTPAQAPAVCSCSCGSPQGVSCSAVNITYFSDGQCGASCGSDGLPGGLCVAAPCQGLSESATPPQVQGGSCTASGTKKVPPITWGASERACTGPVGGGCAAGMVCAAAVGSPFGGTPCVYEAGQQSCPAQYPKATTTYGGANDSRDCGPCACGNPTGLSCSIPTVSLWSDPQCGSRQVSMFAADGTCTSGGVSGGAVAGAISTSSMLQGSGSCPAMGGAATGSVTPTMPTTVCCL